MYVDIIASKVIRRVTEFKNFPFIINNFTIDQSLLSLFSSPLETSMRDINSTDITDITIVHRDLNKNTLNGLSNSKSEVLIIDLLSELKSVSNYNGNFFSTNSLKMININQYKELTRIEQFRSLQSIIANKFLELANSYEKVIIIKFTLSNSDDDEFIKGISNLIENGIDNKLILSFDATDTKSIFNAPLEFYHAINTVLKKYNSFDYENQLLFHESLDNNVLSIYMNYIGQREYIYELYKDGSLFNTSPTTKSRYYNFELKQAGKYRIRVKPKDVNIKPRFTQVIEFSNKKSKKDLHYFEIPDYKSMWLLHIIMEVIDIKALVGSPFKYPNGYRGLSVLHHSELDHQYITSQELLSYAIEILLQVDHTMFANLINKADVDGSRYIKEFLDYLRTKR